MFVVSVKKLVTLHTGGLIFPISSHFCCVTILLNNEHLSQSVMFFIYSVPERIDRINNSECLASIPHPDRRF